MFSQLLATKAKQKRSVAQAIILNVDASLAADYAKLAAELRGAGFAIEVYGDDDKLGKQFKYADRSGIPFALIIGSRESAAGVVKIKDLRLVENNEREIQRADVVAALR